MKITRSSELLSAVSIAVALAGSYAVIWLGRDGAGADLKVLDLAVFSLALWYVLAGTAIAVAAGIAIRPLRTPRTIADRASAYGATGLLKPRSRSNMHQGLRPNTGEREFYEETTREIRELATRCMSPLKMNGSEAMQVAGIGSALAAVGRADTPFGHEHHNGFAYRDGVDAGLTALNVVATQVRSFWIDGLAQPGAAGDGYTMMRASYTEIRTLETEVLSEAATMSPAMQGSEPATRKVAQTSDAARPKSRRRLSVSASRRSVEAMDKRERATSAERQLVVFRLASQVYGVDIGSVREILRMQQITRVPHSPEFVQGVINLRGKICPVVDLRMRFDVEVRELTDDSRIVLANVGGTDVGMIVDAVTEVLRINGDRVEPMPEVVGTGDSGFIEGIANLDERLIILVNLEAAFSEASADRSNAAA